MSTNTAESTTALDDRIRIAGAVRAHYSAAGLSASALAKEIGMSQSKMSRRTTAAEPFDIDQLSAIAHVLGVDITDLITGQNLPARPLRASGGAIGRRGLYLVEEVGPVGLGPTTSTVESRRFDGEWIAPVTELFAATGS